MSVQPTQLPAVVSLGQQRIGLTVLGLIADRYPALPAAYITVQQHTLKVDVQLQTAVDFEVWRQTLAIAPAGTTLHSYAGAAWISAETTVRGVRITVSAGVPVAPHVAAVSPQADAERRYRAAQLTEQHHQAYDPAEPDLTAYIATPAPAVVPVSAAPSVVVPLGQRPDPLESALMSAWAQSEPEGPECHRCGNRRGPWVPDPSGDRWPSGAQKLACKGGCVAEGGAS